MKIKVLGEYGSYCILTESTTKEAINWVVAQFMEDEGETNYEWSINEEHTIWDD